MTARGRAFTLIELLVVIAIISLLAAILFPVFSSARDKARSTACLSNEKQLALGVMQYITDNDEIYPISGMYEAMATNVNALNSPGVGWAGIVYPYIKSDKVFICPSDPTTSPNVRYIVSYAYNEALSTSDPTVNPPLIEAVSRLNAPASTVMYFEVFGNADNYPPSTEQANMTYSGGDVWSPAGNGQSLQHSLSTPGTGMQCETGFMGRTYDDFGTEQNTCQGQNNAALPNSYVNGTTGVHTGGSNFVFADGHAKWLIGTSVSPGYTPTTASATEGDSNCVRSNHCAAGTAGMAPGVVATFSTL